MKLTDLLWGLLLVCLTIFIIDYYCRLPVVHWSVSQGKCVKVIIEGVETGCDEMPEKYERVWVK